ncbi:MAG: GGDEF domain-containing protein [Actinomycetota bacterium]|nr:GGDEF domain-containing protein [Actinomycetota bacterium]
MTTAPAPEVAALERRLRRERAARREAEAIAERVTSELYESVQLLACSHAVLDETADFVAITDAGGQIAYGNRSFGELVGVGPDELVGTSVLALLDLASQQRFEDEAAPALAGKGLWRGELVIERPDRIAVPVSQVVVAHKRSDGQVERLSFVARDITEQRALQDQLSRDATHDMLTGLANRRLFHLTLDQAVQTARDNRSPLAALFIDLDGFKQVNDTFGHDAGDQVLTVVAQRLQQHLRHNDVLARMGGDEFALLCPDVSSEAAALEVAARLTAAVNEPMNLPGVPRPLTVGMSTGIAYTDGDDFDADVLLRSADEAMYQAKWANKGGYQLLNLTIPAPRPSSDQAALG